MLLIAFGLLMLYPLLWMLASSFKPTDEIFSEPSAAGRASVSFEQLHRGLDGAAHPFEPYLSTRR